MEKDEWKRSQHDADDQNPEEHDRRTDTKETAAGDAVPYMEQFYQMEEGQTEEGQLEEDEPEQGESGEDRPEEVNALTETVALTTIETIVVPFTDSLPEQWPIDQSDDLDETAADEWDEQEPAIDTPMEAEELNQVIEDICRSKAEEFRMLGYEQVTGREIWECVSDKYQKTGVPPLHRIVNDILSLKVTQFMNWMTMSMYKGAHFR